MVATWTTPSSCASRKCTRGWVWPLCASTFAGWAARAVPTVAAPAFFFNDPATTEIYTTVHTLPLHDALPISESVDDARACNDPGAKVARHRRDRERATF